MSDQRCGKCGPCQRVTGPCEEWVKAAVARIKRELESPEFAKVLRDFDNRHED